MWVQNTVQTSSIYSWSFKKANFTKPKNNYKPNLSWEVEIPKKNFFGKWGAIQMIS